MNVILQDALPLEMQQPNTLPGMAPCGKAHWLRVDEAYAAQMAYRGVLMADMPSKVMWLDPGALGVAQEVLRETLALLPGMGFEVSEVSVHCPDGRDIELDWLKPLRTLGTLVQEDICILQKRGNEHVLIGAVLCFPANWRLADKVGRPLTAIHDPVDEYDGNIARRVQRLFDGVRVGRPLWRFNFLRYADADLHQPYRKIEGNGPFIRSERQCVVRMPKSDAVVFSIHTYVVMDGTDRAAG